jgi:hypothetical protein
MMRIERMKRVFVYGENCKTIIDYDTTYLVISTEYKKVLIG